MVERTAKAQEDICIPAEEYDDMVDRLDWLEALEQAGVDDWDGIDFAHEIYKTFR